VCDAESTQETMNMDTNTMHMTMARRGVVGARVRTVDPGACTVTPGTGTVGLIATGIAAVYCEDHGTGRSPWTTQFTNACGAPKRPSRHLGPPST